MKVGGVAETITVTGETPIVDVQSVRRQTTLEQRAADDGADGAVVGGHRGAVPGITIQAGTSADIQVTPQMTVFGGAGGRTNEGRMQVDGLGTGAALNGGGVSTYVADISNAQEVVTTNSGGMGEAEVGGPAMNIVPRSGGNTRQGPGLPLRRAAARWSAATTREALQDAGLSTPGKLLKQWDETFGVGGPIKKDRLWYYGTYRDEGQHRSIPGDLPEPERRRSDQMGVRAGYDQTGARRGKLSAGEHPPDLAGDAAEQGQLPLGRADGPATAPRSRPTGMRAARSRSDDAFYGSLGLGGLTATSSPETARISAHAGPEPSGHLAIAGDQPAAARSRRRDLPRGVGRV